jgi:hypothetical protein
VQESADRGKLRHKLCEEYVKAKMTGAVFTPDPIIKDFTAWAEKNIERFLWSEMNCYSSKHWLGGISDAGFVDKQGKVSILDFKSSREAYLSQFWQIAGYAIQVEENGGYTEKGEKVYEAGTKVDYFTVFPFGAKNAEPQFYHDVEGAKECFLSALKLYRALPR